MNLTDKPARMISKLTDANRKKDAEIARLEQLAKQQLAEIDHANTSQLKSAQDAHQLQLSLTSTERQIAELLDLNARATTTLDDLAMRYDMAVELADARRVLISKLDAIVARVVDALGLAPGNPIEDALDAIAIHRENTRLLEAHAVVHALVAEQQAALCHILDDVRSRMRRKEREEESAILNRKALATAAPGRNVR